jgi:hypothetical protein
MLFGALIGQKVTNILGAIILALISHYLLDLLPHVEYSIKNIPGKNWHKEFSDMLKISLDVFLGILLIFIFSDNSMLVYTCVFFSVLPDGLTILNAIFKNSFLGAHSKFHQEKLHFLKDKKISGFWRLLTQFIIVIVCLFFFLI